jgi:hypothetical protein
MVCSCTVLKCLKVPKCEIFDLLDFPHFYTIKPPWVRNFGTAVTFFETVSFWL